MVLKSPAYANLCLVNSLNFSKLFHYFELCGPLGENLARSRYVDLGPPSCQVKDLSFLEINFVSFCLYWVRYHIIKLYIDFIASKIKRLISYW